MRRLERLARNQMLFRNVNERVNAVRGVSAYREAYLCECSRADCVEELELGREEYVVARRAATHFVIKPGHDFPELEQVIDQNDRYAIVEKVGQAATVADEARSGGQA